MNLSQLPYIIAIARCGSLCAAAKELGITQPALSKYLAGLEQSFGVNLFFRCRKKLYPTPAGKLYIQSARKITEIMHSTVQTIKTMDSPITSQFKVGISPHWGISILIQNYPAFNRKFPMIRLSPKQGYADTLKELLQQKELDFAITSGEASDGLIKYDAIQEEIVLAVPAMQPVSHDVLPGFFKNLPYVYLSDFSNSVFILPEAPSSMEAAIKPLFLSENFQPQFSLSTPNTDMVYQLICAGSGIGFLPAHYVQPNPRISFYRLRTPAFLCTGFFFRENHVFASEERYLMYLTLRRYMKYESDMLSGSIRWNDFTRALLWEYAPEDARAMKLEELR